MIEQLKKYLEWEYTEMKDLLDNPPDWCSTYKQKTHFIWNSAQRCLGATMFAQRCGVPCEDVAFYEKYREKILALINECQ